jgi:hypothetical protein
MKPINNPTHFHTKNPSKTQPIHKRIFLKTKLAKLVAFVSILAGILIGLYALVRHLLFLECGNNCFKIFP